MIKRVDHIELVVKDVEEFVSLFKKMGFKEVLRTTHHGVSAEVQLPGSDQVIFEIHQMGTEENPGINHIAFLVDDIQKTYEEMTAQGVKFDNPPSLVKASGRFIVNFRDPGGFRLQLTDSKREKPEYI